MDISIIIINWNTKELLENALTSVFKTVTDLKVETFVVDNGSKDGSPEMVKENFPNVNLIENKENLGFAKANNIAIKKTKGKHVLLLNSDTVLTENCVKKSFEYMEDNEKVGICGTQLINEDGSKQNSFDNYPTLLTELFNKNLLRLLRPKKYPSKKQNLTEPLEVESVIGAFMLVRKKAIDEVGLLDEDYFFFLEETDWCLRMRKANWKIIHLPYIKVYHLQGESKNKAPGKGWIEYYRSNYKFFKKNRSMLSYLLLRFGKLIKLNINLLLSFLGLVLTIFLNQKLRRKFLIYSELILWHLKLCPKNVGLKNLKE